ncbi:MAG: 23S rRNA (pseudouridine(1915)-N(3))-methyltransferase RlmH [Hyphomicrobium sp.]
MRLLIAAIGKLKDDEERAICARYAMRLAGAGKAIALGPLEIVELPEKRAAAAVDRKADESERLLKAAASATYTIALDAAGRAFSSEQFAALLGAQRDAGAKSCAFLIGGPDGHGDAALTAANLKLSLGALTLPHGLARVVLCEQLYRAATILSGHPYHRA